jgi:hypothetical protein
MLRFLLKFCQNILFSNIFKSLNKFFFKILKHRLQCLKNVFAFFLCLLDWLQIYSHVPMIYYECFYINKSNNFNIKVLVTLVVFPLMWTHHMSMGEWITFEIRKLYNNKCAWRFFNGFSNTKHVTSFFINMNNRCIKWHCKSLNSKV